VAVAGFVGLAIAASAQQMVSRDWRRVLLGVEVALGADLGLATRTVEQAAQELYQDEQWRPWLLDEPEVWGGGGAGTGVDHDPARAQDLSLQARAGRP